MTAGIVTNESFVFLDSFFVELTEGGSETMYYVL